MEHIFAALACTFTLTLLVGIIVSLRGYEQHKQRLLNQARSNFLCEGIIDEFEYRDGLEDERIARKQ